MSVLLEIFDHAAVFSYRYIKSTFRSGSVVVLTFTFADLIEYKATKDIEFYLQDHGKVVCQGILFHWKKTMYAIYIVFIGAAIHRTIHGKELV